MSEDQKFQAIQDKLDMLCNSVSDVSDKQDDLQEHIQELNKQMPGDEALQTQAGCKRIKNDVDEKIDAESKRRIRDTSAIGGLAILSLVWHFWRLIESSGHRAAVLVRNLLRAWI